MSYLETLLGWSEDSDLSPSAMREWLDTHAGAIIQEYAASSYPDIYGVDPESFLADMRRYFAELESQAKREMAEHITSVPISDQGDSEVSDILHVVHLRLWIDSVSAMRHLSHAAFPDQWNLKRPVTPHLITIVEILDETGAKVENRIVHSVGSASHWNHDAQHRPSMYVPGSKPDPRTAVQRTHYRMSSRMISQDYDLRQAVARNFQYRVGKAWLYLIPTVPRDNGDLGGVLTKALKEKAVSAMATAAGFTGTTFGGPLTGSIASMTVAEIGKLAMSLLEELEKAYPPKNLADRTILIPLTKFARKTSTGSTTSRMIPNVKYKKPKADLKFGTGQRLWAQGKGKAVFTLKETLQELYARRSPHSHTVKLSELDITATYGVDVRYSFRRIKVDTG